jgi:hypothetical protein
MHRRSPAKVPTKPLYAKLPMTLHIGLQKLALENFEKTGRKLKQTELLVQAIRDFLRRAGIDISQIEARVSDWDINDVKKSNVTIFRKKPKRS